MNKQEQVRDGVLARLRRERDEAHTRLARVCEAVEYAALRWSEWGQRAETVADMLDVALDAPIDAPWPPQEGEDGQ